MSGSFGGAHYGGDLNKVTEKHPSFGDLLDADHPIGGRLTLAVLPFLDGVSGAVADELREGLIIEALLTHVIQEFHVADIPPQGEHCQPPVGERQGKVFFGTLPAMGNSLKKLRLARKWTHDKAADRMGISRSQFIKLERGERKLTERTIDLGAKAFGVTKAEILGDDELATFEADQPEEKPRTRMVPIIGYVGASSRTHVYAVPAGQLDEIEAPEGASDKTVAVEIKGESLGALFDRWVVFYDEVRDPVTSDLVGKLCVVGLADERILIKKLRRAPNGLFDLLSNTEEPIEAVAVTWAAKVIDMRPR